jgi:dihydropteroate synthase
MTPARPPLLMGVVNVTPDSFSDGGAFLDPAQAIDHALKLIDEGAAMIDIGGESTRPGSEPVDEAAELSRVLPVIRGLSAKSAAAISIDTRRPRVARACIEAGASIWNDVSALTFAPESMAVAAALGCRIALMHAQGDPKSMQADPRYGDVVRDVAAFLSARIIACEAAGVGRGRLIVDPGVGFGKTLAHNLALIGGLSAFGALGCPVLLGVSRKRFIAAIDRPGPAGDRLGGSLAAAIAGAARGAAILRVHDVAATRQALAVHFAVETGQFRR